MSHKYHVWCEDWHGNRERGEFTEICAGMAHEAAKLFAERYNDEGDITDRGDGLEVHVRTADPMGKWQKYRAFANLEIIYSAVLEE